MQDKRPYNELQRKHGHWEEYWSNDVAFYIGHYLNGVKYGYFIWRNKNNDIEEEEYYAR